MSLYQLLGTEVEIKFPKDMTQNAKIRYTPANDE